MYKHKLYRTNGRYLRVSICGAITLYQYTIKLPFSPSANKVSVIQAVSGTTNIMIYGENCFGDFLLLLLSGHL